MSPSAALATRSFSFILRSEPGCWSGPGRCSPCCVGGFTRTSNHAWSAYRGWLVMVPLLLGVDLPRREPPRSSSSRSVAIFGFKEFARATGLYQDWPMTGAVYLGILAIGGRLARLRSVPGSCPAGTACSWRCRCT